MKTHKAIKENIILFIAYSKWNRFLDKVLGSNLLKEEISQY